MAKRGQYQWYIQECLNIEKEIIKYFDNFGKENLRTGDSSISDNLENVDHANSQIEQLQKSKLRLLRNFNETIINESDFKLLNADYDAEIKQYEQSRAESEKKLTVYRSKDKLLQGVKEYVSRINPDTATFEEKQNFIRAFVKTVTLDRGLFWTGYRNPEAHRIYIDYKFDSLTSLRLSSNIEVGYKPNGHRSGEKTHEITLLQSLHLGDEKKEGGTRLFDDIDHKY